MNTYGGAFSVAVLEVTLMAGPEAAMRAEQAYLKSLGGAKSFQVADGVLTLFEGGRKRIADLPGGDAVRT